MEKLLALWNILNGKKTTIGALMMLFAQVLRMTGQGDWAEVVDELIHILNLSGMGLAAVGLSHKAKKVVTD